MTDYKTTLNLPKTDFPMRANLAKREPEMLAAWNEMDLYGEIRKVRRGSPITYCMTAPRTRTATFILPRRQQSTQGHYRQGTFHGRLRCPLCARLGLPWPAYRASGRKDRRQGG